MERGTAGNVFSFSFVYLSVLSSSPRGAGRLSEQSDLARVSPEVSDVVLNPGEGEDLVPQSQVTRHLLSGRAEEPKRAQPVVDAHHNHSAVNEVLRSEVPECSGAADKSSTMNPYYDWKIWSKIFLL